MTTFIAPRSQPNPDLRCGYCHGAAVDVVPCAACGALLHPDCRAQAGGCSTLGCVQRTVRPPRGAAGSRWGDRRARAELRTRLCLLAIFAAAGLWFWDLASPERAVAYWYYNPRVGISERSGSFGFQLDRGPRATDPWGRPWLRREPSYIFVAADRYSAGPNGVDERGLGDDVQVPLYDGRELRATYVLLRARYASSALACAALALMIWSRLRAGRAPETTDSDGPARQESV